MAIEQRFTPPWSGLALTTGLKPKRFVTISSTKSPGPYVKYPAVGAAAVGVLLSGSTGSTNDFQPVSIMTHGIARIEAIGSSLHYGHIVTASSVGRAKVSTAGTKRLGVVVQGTSGTTGRVVSVLLGYPASTA